MPVPLERVSLAPVGTVPWLFPVVSAEVMGTVPGVDGGESDRGQNLKGKGADPDGGAGWTCDNRGPTLHYVIRRLAGV